MDKPPQFVAYPILDSCTPLLFAARLFACYCLHSPSSKLAIFFAKLHTFLTLNLSLFIFQYTIRSTDTPQSNSAKVSKVIDWIEMCVGNTAMVGILGQVLMGNNEMWRIFAHLDEVDSYLQTLNVHANYKKTKFKQTVQLALTTVLLSTVLILLSARSNAPPFFDSLHYYYTTIYPPVLIALSYLIFTNLCRAIHKRFGKINEILLQISHTDPHRIVSDRKLRLMSHLYEKLFEAATLLDSSFTVSNLLSYAFYFMSITSRLFLIIVTLSNEPPDKWLVNLNFIAAIAWLGILVMPMISLTAICHHTTEESKKSAIILHRISFRVGPQYPAFDDIELISLQFVHQQVGFSAFGFFNIDLSVLYAVIGAIFTYIVILLQFNFSMDSTGGGVMSPSPIDRNATGHHM